MRKQNHVFYQEIQRPRQWWVLSLTCVITVLNWYIFIKQIFFDIQVGDRPAPDVIVIIFWLIFGVLFPIFIIWFLKLIIQVRADGIYIRFLPFHLHERKILFKVLEDYEMISYRMLDFGGWGIRMTIEGDTVYNMYGNDAVKLILTNQSIVIGTQNPDELVQVIESLKDSK